VKIKSYSLFFIILLVPGCTKKDMPADGLPRICGMLLKEADGIRLKSESPPVLEATGFPASVRISNSDPTELRTCTFELTGPQVRPEQLFFRFGPQEAKVEVLSKDRVRITYPIRFRSYGMVSLEPVATAPAKPYKFKHAGLSFFVTDGALLRIDAGVPLVRSLGPATEVIIENDGETPRPVELLVNNASEQLSKAITRGIGAKQVKLTRECPLLLRLTGTLPPSQRVQLTLLPRPLRYPYSFVFGGDVKEQLEIFLQLIKQVRAKADPLFMLAVGDYTRNSLPSEINLFLRQTGDLPFPVYYVKGNHESRCQGDIHYRRFFGPENFSFIVDRMLFVVMDTSGSVHDKRGYQVTSTAFLMAENALAKYTGVPWKFLMLHAPPHPLHGPYLHADLNSNLSDQHGQRIRALAEKNQVAYVLSGHAHLYARGVENGVVYLTSGGGGAILHNIGQVPGFSINTEKHLMLFRVTADGIEEEMITLR
jgi:predicted phosphodiesterase